MPRRNSPTAPIVIPADAPSGFAANPLAIDLRGATMVRGGRKLLDNVSLQVPIGATCAVIGANGAGKTSLLRLLEGYEFPTLGSVTVLGQTLGQCDVSRLRKRVRLVGSAGFSSGAYDSSGTSQPGWARDFPPNMPLSHVVATGAAGHLVHYGSLSPAEVLAALKALRNVGLGNRDAVLWAYASAGERTRTLLARARMPAGGLPASTSTLLLLDEPTSALDPAARARTVAAMGRSARHITQLVVTHHVEELPPQTSLALVLRDGKVLAFGPARKILTTQVLSRAFRHPLKVAFRSGRWSARPA